ncbi:MAG: filamentous hemagglutinin family protein [Gammaproteobacteria bacterium]|nr:filamentous hemagglutinin family protein [Gammaproteobacteria bacterium]MBU1407222.1 filamentous hemagglutinin family protein [Gammaproteobacteria bacterium]MBU1531404.1 filamentous hemagglutinin family protein [Gammaproteobacteria bacterium]
MNRNRYRLVFNTTSGMMVPVAETARRHGKAASGPALALAGVLLAGPVQAELPVASANFAAPGTIASYQASGTQAYINQVGNKAIVNFQTGNISAGHDLQVRQVDDLITKNLVPDAVFSLLARIHDTNPTIIAGSISQAAGQKANVIMVNSNGIAFMGGSQVNLNQFTASTLNIQDEFIGNLLARTASPQFEKALDDGAAHGFIKVMEGARISAGNSGRVMLIAPTVVNKGTIDAPDGQIIVAAGSKVYLRASDDNNVRGLLVEVDSPAGVNAFDTANTDVKDGSLDGQTVALAEAAEDKLGHVTNLGELATPRGNVTMVGYAVNQKGIARATTSVVANGSIYLMAKDTAYLPGTQNTSSQRTGQVTLGAGSVTEILPETQDGTMTQDGKLDDGSANIGLDQPSRVVVLGRDIRVEGDAMGENGETLAGALIHAPSGKVSFYAVDASSGNTVRNLIEEGGLLRADTAVSTSARVHLGSGARIDVAGLENVEVSVERNVQEVELRGDELKDSPVNRDGAIRNEKVYVDVERALTRAEAGESTLISKDRLEALRAQEQRTVAERSTLGGTIELHSQGEAIIESGTVFDVSGGSLKYTSGKVKTTLLTSNGRLVDIADADAETHFDGIATRYVKDYGRWNRKEVIDLGQSYNYDPGYAEGKNAGAVSVFGMSGTVMQASVAGRTLTGERQRDAGIAPRGARLTLGYDDASAIDLNKGSDGYQDYKLNQRVEVVSTGALLPAGFGFGDALPAELKSTLTLDPALVGEGKVGELAIYSNQAAAVREALAAPANGVVTIAAPEVSLGADIEAGTIDIAARFVKGQTIPVTPTIDVADGVTLSARGQWVNDMPGMGLNDATSRIDGGAIKLNAETIADGPGSYRARGKIVFGEDVSLDADGGSWLKVNGKLSGGNGGDISVRGYFVSGWDDVDVHAYGIGEGGTLTLGANRIQMGGSPLAAADAIDLDTGFFAHGGFADYSLKALTSLVVAENAQIRAALTNRELATVDRLRASGAPVANLGQLGVRDDRVRQAVSLNLSAGLKAAETGDLIIGENARIETDPKANITLEAYRLLDIEGSVATTGGSIEASADESFGTVWLGDAARLDAAGRALTYTDNQGLTQGEVLAGGQVSLSAGGVVAKEGSTIDISGAVPVRLDVPNESGGLGRMVGSDAGTLAVLAQNAALLDGEIAAHGGSASNRGGMLDFTLGVFEEPALGVPLPERVLHLAQTASEQSTGLQAGDSLAGTQTMLSAVKIEAAGFDRLRLSSRDAIRLEDGLELGAGRVLPLREVTLDAASIQTAGGDAAVSAETVRLGNYHPGRRAASTAPTSTGTLKVAARQLELAGELTLGGMARAELIGTEEIRLAGISVANARPEGELKAAADLLLHGALVAPTSYSLYTIDASGHSVAFTRSTDTPVQPWSVLGSLTVRADDIAQGGNLWAPFGSIDLQAADSLVFENGSLTSVAATPGSLTPFGKVENGRAWIFDVDASRVDKLQVADLDGKAIRASGASVDMQSGAKVDLSGGGDIQAYEFTTGPGGSHDILADDNIYAIMPGYTGGYAMADAQNDQSRKVGEATANKIVFDRAPGDAVYLSGVPGLPDGVYTLLPAHYALLPGAYAVKLNADVRLLPGQSYSRQDGVRVAAGYLTDTRVNAPKDANWQGVEVLTREQVLARSEFTLTNASKFFADSRNRPQDAGLLSAATTGSGTNALKLDAVYDFAAGEGGRGAQVDISALKLAITSGTPDGIASDVVVLDAGKLNDFGAESLFIGGTRAVSGDTTTLTVGADSVTLANDASHALKAGEIMLAAKGTLELESGSAIDAQGPAGDAGHYETAGNGALVRAASTRASFARTGSPDRSQGTLTGAADSTVIAADSITLDATKENAFKGTAKFEQQKSVNGDVVRVLVAGNLAVGASRINFGNAPVGSEGFTYTQDELNAIDLAELTLTSYSTFDLYGDVVVGKLDAGKPVLQNLSLQGAGLAGLDNAGQTAQLNAQNLTLTNPNNAASFTAGGALGTGNLEVKADTLTLGAGDKAIQGFGAVTVTANELVGSGTGKLDVSAPVTLNVARISGERGADQAFDSTDTLSVAQHSADRVLAPVTALGAKWALQGTSVDFDSHAELPSGSIKLTATAGNIELGENATIDVAGRSVQFFDVSKPSWGGTAEFVSTGKIDSDSGQIVAGTGNVTFDEGAKVDVSAAAGGDAGTLIVRAANGSFTLADGSVSGAETPDTDGKRGDGARADIDVKTLNKFDDEGNQVTSFSTFNTALNTGGFDGERRLRVRNGDVSIAETDKVKALNIHIAADSGKLDVAGELDASGKDAGRIELFANDAVNVKDTAKLTAKSSGANEEGGDIEIGTRDGKLDLASGSAIDVSGGTGGQGGTVLLRAGRTATGVNITTLKSSGLNSARSVSVEAVKIYDNIATLNASSANAGGILGLTAIKADNAAFASNHANIKTDLEQPDIHILSGVEVRSTGDLTLSADWNLKGLRDNGEVGVLTLRAADSLKINSNLSDGFSHATPCTTATCAATPAPATLLAGESWTYRLVGGADQTAADPLATQRASAIGKGNVEVAAGKLVRTGTGDIHVAAGGNIELKDDKAAIYTAGRVADLESGFTTPASVLNPVFSQNGGDVALRAQGDILGKATSQLYSEWLYRQGAINSTTGFFDKQPAWWVRFDQFQQGVGALGGGDVALVAGGTVKDVSASAATQGRTSGTSPNASSLVVTGGGDVRVEAGTDVLGGTYYSGRGDILVQAGGGIGASGTIKPLVALGDASARLRAAGDVNLGNAISPQLLPQSAGNLRIAFPALLQPVRSLFSTYGAESSIALESLSGNTSMGQNTARLNNANSDQPQYLLPSSLAMTSFQGDIEIGEAGSTTPLTMNPSATGGIELLGAGNAKFNNSLTLSDMDPGLVPGAVKPTNIIASASTSDTAVPKLIVNPITPRTTPNAHATNPLHGSDSKPVRVYALNGDVSGLNTALVTTVLNTPKRLELKAGGDVRDVTLHIQHVGAQDVSHVEAGRSVVFGTTSDRRDNAQIRIGGPGRLEVTAGEHVDLGTSGGIVSRGNLDNAALPSGGADLRLAAGVGAASIDYVGTVDRVLAQLQAGSPDDTTLWLARWLTGDDTLEVDNALAAVLAVDAIDENAQKAHVVKMLYTALRITGRDSLNQDSDYAADYARGYAALATVFPGIEDKNADGTFKHYEGDINLFASRVKTEQGGGIDFMAPGGDVIVGLANTPAALVNVGNNVLGIVVSAEGDIRGFSRDDILVNQSRILTVGGGDVLLWSSEGDIDAGKGKKSASAVPPPVIKIDPSTGLTTLELLGAVSGSGIGALESPGVTAGDVDLIAPKGTVNAGDAGIRAGNLNIAAQVVLGADNISVSGSSTGTPVADTSAVAAASSGASNAGGDVSSTTAALSQNLAEAARAAEELKQAFKPTFITAEVIGHGDCDTSRPGCL